MCVVYSIGGGGGRNVWGEIEEGRKSGGGRKGLLLCAAYLVWYVLPIFLCSLNSSFSRTSHYNREFSSITMWSGP